MEFTKQIQNEHVTNNEDGKLVWHVLCVFRAKIVFIQQSGAYVL